VAEAALDAGIKDHVSVGLSSIGGSRVIQHWDLEDEKHQAKKALTEGKVDVLDDFPGVTAGAWQHRPESIGWVRAKTADVFDDPEIQPNYLSDPMDRRVHLGGIRLIRRLLNAPELKPFLSDETLPGPHIESDDELLDFARRNGSTTYHLIGTARMGPNTDPTAVVDDRLRVHGLEGPAATPGRCILRSRTITAPDQPPRGKGRDRRHHARRQQPTRHERRVGHAQYQHHLRGGRY
jgi:hypothetical protein